MTWQEVTVLAFVTLGATAANLINGFDPSPVYAGVIGWGAARKRSELL